MVNVTVWKYIKFIPILNALNKDKEYRFVFSLFFQYVKMAQTTSSPISTNIIVLYYFIFNVLM